MKNIGAGILFICNNSVLLLQNKKGIWEIPGGKKDTNEKLIKTATRETAEECGLCPSFKLVGKYVFENKKNKYKIFYGIVDSKFKCQISDEHLDYGWFNLKKLPRPLHNKIAGALEFISNYNLSLDNINTV